MFRNSDFSMPLLLAALMATLAGAPAHAATFSGTVDFDGSVSFAAPIAGIALDDLTVASGPGIQPTGNGEHCEITANGSAGVDAGGLYPEAGTLSVGLEISKGGGMGGQDPEGNCLLQLRASGTDGADVSAYGTLTVVITAAQIQGSADISVADDIVVRQSKTQAGLDKDCLKWVKKQTKLRGKCNATLWKMGGTEGSLKCKDADVEPPACDPGNYVESVLALSFGDTNQQTDALNADAIDLELLSEQAKCQRYIGKASANFFARRNQLVQKTCVAELADDLGCRSQATTDSRSKLSVIDNCITDQEVDASGVTIMDVDEPCRTASITLGVLDRKALKDCLEFELSTLSDGVIGDVPECGNGVLQGGEVCDDGNVASGDCCSATCTAEAAGSQTCGVGICEVTTDACNAGEPVTCTPGPAGVEAGNCGDTLDNDCDGFTDLDDVDCI